MASPGHYSTSEDHLQSRIKELTGQLEAARAQFERAASGSMRVCSACNGERRPEELVGGVCKPCHQIHQMRHHLTKLRTVTEMTVMMAARLSEATGEPRHVVLDHFERQATVRIAAADAAVTATRISA